MLGSLAPGSATVVVLMGLGRRRGIAACLLERGWPHDTASAIVLAASTPQAEVWTGTLGELGETAVPVANDLPGTIVIGPVVDLHAVLGARADELSPTVAKEKG